ncbi:rod shape-determining protein MreC [Taibaiella soli]|uniref:rod shape-determining protein MreC n=1 Tax=Taibaiella soli TaxID=1649169 RepID=UPI001403D9C5|nr:rod shape-determining protein MreC [Taibaiella soli]
MRTFILFIRRFFNLIFFLGLEIVCIVLIARTKTLQGNELMNSANSVSGYFYNKQNDLVYYFGLRQMNDSLLNENARLRSELAAYSAVDTAKDGKTSLPLNFSDSTHVLHFAEYHYRTARVINNSVTSANNYLTIARGSEDGIEKNMTVISSNGLVGRVENVSKHFATVLSMLNVKQPVSAKLKEGTTFSVVNWEGERPDVLLMKGIAQEIKVKNNDSVYTTGYSQYLPANILIGTVFKKEILKKDNTQQLSIRPATNFRNLQYVYVIENKMSGERTQLEDSTKGKNK